MTRPSELSVAEIKRYAQARAGEIVRELVPQGRMEGPLWSAPNPRAGDGKRGSFKAYVSGPKAGGFVEYKGDGEKGDILHLIAYAKGVSDWKGREGVAFAVAWVKHRYGLSTMAPAQVDQVRRQTSAAQLKAEADETAARERRQRRAFEIYQQAYWLDCASGWRDQAAPVRAYMAARGCPIEDVPFWGRSIKVHPSLEHWMSAEWVNGRKHRPGQSFPAMVAPIVKPHGELTGIHCTFLRPDGSAKAPVSPPKLMLGEAKAGFVEISHGPTELNFVEAVGHERASHLVAGEGIETSVALAIALGDQARVVAALSLGNLAHLPVESLAVSGLTIARENDTSDKARATADAVCEALETRCRKAGKSFDVMVPPSEFGDFADLLEGKKK